MAIEYKNHRAILMITKVQQRYEIHKYMYNHVFDILHMQALHKWDDS